MDKVATGIVDQLVSHLEDLPDTFSVRRLTDEKCELTVYDPIMFDDNADDGDDPKYIVEFKVTKVK